MGKIILFIAFATFIGFSRQALTRLQNAGIAISSSGRCSDRQNRRCTSLEQIRENTINGVVALKSASGCTINVTGGTERGHAGGTYSHYNGYKIDISLNSCINGYITGNYLSNGIRRDGAPTYRDGSGNIYAKAGNHWDILYY